MARCPYIGPDLTGRTFSRILLIKPSSLGDIVHAMPVLAGLRSRFPRAKIDWLISTKFASILDGLAGLDEVIPFRRRRFAALGANPRATAEFMRFVRELRRRRYDLAIDLQGLFRTGFLSWASGAGVRLGLCGAREAAWLFYTHRIRVSGLDQTHAVDRYYLVAGVLGFAEYPIAFNLEVPDSLRNECRLKLLGMGLHEGQRLVAVVPGARWETKVWLPGRFAETIDALQSNGTVRCALLGSREDADLCASIEAACGSKPINLAGRTDLRRLAAVVAVSDVVLCHDSAAMHLAVAFERPLVCLVGPTNPARTGPYRRPNDVLRVALPCAPCYLRRLAQCPFDHRCMTEITSAAVVSAVKREMLRSALADPTSG